MSVERDDGLEFPWLLPLLAVPAIPLLRRAQSPALPVTGPVPEPVTVSSETAVVANARVDAAADRLVAAETAAAIQRSTPQTATTPAEMRLAQSQQQTSAAVSKIVDQHEAAVVKNLFPQAARLTQAGVPQAEISRRVQAVVEKLPSTQLKRAAQEIKATGRITDSTAKALKTAGEVYPDIKRKIDQAKQPLLNAKKAVETEVRQKVEQKLKPVRDVQKAVEKNVPAPIRREINTVTQPLRREAVQAGKAVVSDAAKAIGVGPAKQLAQDTLRKMNIPTSIPVVLPTSLTPDGIKDAAYGAGKKYLEGAMQSAIGISIPLPTKFSAKEIQKTLTGLLPKDAKEALERGLDIGAQVGASALSSALVGATIGSAIPGLGTVIGLGVAIGVSALKGAVKKALTETHASQQRCKSEDKYKVKLPVLSPLELIPWVAQKTFDMSKAVAEEQRKTKCGRTPYRSGLRDLVQQSVEISKSTIPVLGLQQLDKLIPLYEKAPKQAWYWDKGTIQPGGHIVGGTNKVLFGPSANGYDILALLKMMKERRAKLQNIVARSARIEQLAPSELAPLRWEIVTEIGNAAMEYQLTGSSDAKKWLQQLGGFMQRMVKREAAAVGAMQSRQAQDLQRKAELERQGKASVVTGII